MHSLFHFGRTTFKSCLAASIAFCGAPHAHAQQIGDPVPNSFICAFDQSVGSVSSKAQLAAMNAGGRVTHVYSHSLRGFSVTMSLAAVEQMMRTNPDISYCEQDRYAGLPDPAANAQGKPSNPGGGGGGGSGGGGGGGGGKPAPAQTTPWGVAFVGGPTDGTGKRAWIIDTGIDLNHPDLNVDVADSVSFLSGQDADDDNGHGTHVAGTIAAIDNSFGVVGIAAGAWVVSLRVLDRRGSGPDSGVIAAIDHAAANGSPGDVINLSLITSYMQSMNDAVTAAGAKGIFVVSAAGNSQDNAGNYSPASASGTNVYTASAIADDSRTWAFYSNYGNPPIDYAEPGSNIDSLDKNGGYTTKSGTSMAAPHLAGILLASGGTVNTSGTAVGDPDGSPDPVGVR